MLVVLTITLVVLTILLHISHFFCLQGVGSGKNPWLQERDVTPFTSSFSSVRMGWGWSKITKAPCSPGAFSPCSQPCLAIQPSLQNGSCWRWNTHFWRWLLKRTAPEVFYTSWQFPQKMANGLSGWSDLPFRIASALCTKWLMNDCKLIPFSDT